MSGAEGAEAEGADDDGAVAEAAGARAESCLYTAQPFRCRFTVFLPIAVPQ